MSPLCQDRAEPYVAIPFSCQGIAAQSGALLVVPTYFQQVRGESTLDTGPLIAPQGIGALPTMPLAGALVDKHPVGRIVPICIVLIVLGVAGMTLIESDMSYRMLIGICS